MGPGAQAPVPSVNLRTFIRPADYLATVYADPQPGAGYLFYPEDRVKIEILLSNASSVPVSIQVNSDPSTHIAFRAEDGPDRSTYVQRERWSVSGDLHTYGDGVAQVDVAPGTSFVLQPHANLVIPIDLGQAANWPSGVVVLLADVSLECRPTCRIVPHSNAFRFEVRTTFDRIDRMERAYRRALRSLFADDLDGTERALARIDAEYSNSVMSLYMRATVAERRGNRMNALRFYRAVEAALLSRSDAIAVRKLGVEIDEFLHAIRVSIQRLEAAR